MEENIEMVEEGKCGCDNPRAAKICRKPFYDAFNLCLICSHPLTCHRDSDSVEATNAGSNK